MKIRYLFLLSLLLTGCSEDPKEIEHRIRQNTLTEVNEILTKQIDEYNKNKDPLAALVLIRASLQIIMLRFKDIQ